MKKNLLFAVAALLIGYTVAAQTDTVVSKIPSQKNVIIEEYTGVNCSYCPAGHKIASDIAAAHPGRVFPINIHQGVFASMYTTSFGDALAAQTNLDGYPMGTVNRHVFSGSRLALERNSFETCSNIILAQSSPLNIAAWGTLDYSTRELVLTVQLYYTASSNSRTNMLNVAVVQDSVLGSQAGSSLNPSQVVGTKYRHMHMLRHLITGQWGETVTETTAGSFVEKTYTYTLPDDFGVTGDMLYAPAKDLHFIVFVAEGHDEIITGTEAEIIPVNIPAIDLKTVEMQEVVHKSCDNIIGAKVSIRNFDATSHSNVVYCYKSGDGDYDTLTYNGSIASGATVQLTLPEMETTVNVPGNVYFKVISADGQDIVSNEKSFLIEKFLYSCGGWMMLEIKPDVYGDEITYRIYGPSGELVQRGGPLPRASSYNSVKIKQFAFTPTTVGCYRLEVYDSYGDGFPSGYIKLYDANHDLVFSHDGNIGSKMIFQLDVTAPTGIEEQFLSDENINVYPNPAHNMLNFDCEEGILRVDMFNMQGQMVKTQSGDVRTMNINDVADGIYMLKITTPSSVSTQKIVKK